MDPGSDEEVLVHELGTPVGPPSCLPKSSYAPNLPWNPYQINVGEYKFTLLTLGVIS